MLLVPATSVLSPQLFTMCSSASRACVREQLSTLTVQIQACIR